MQKIIEERDKYGVLVRKYIQGRLLGKGGFAKCYSVIDCDTKDELAAKVIDKASLSKPKTKQKLLSEIKIHSTLHHPNLVSYRRCFEDDRYVYIILELCSEFTLMEHSKRKRRFTETEASYLIDQCIRGLRYMHGNAVIHRDLKLSNLLVNDQFVVKIADFGLATQLEFDGERKRTICGTPNYIAPEILDGGHAGHSYEVDIWSLGVIMYTLLVGKPPFEMSDMKSTYRRIKEASYSFPPDLYISLEAKNLIRRVLQAEPSRRPDLSGIENDPFFKLYPPSSLAPLSLFQPGTQQYYAQEQRLAQVQSPSRYRRSPLQRLDSNLPGNGVYRRGSSVMSSATRSSSSPKRAATGSVRSASSSAKIRTPSVGYENMALSPPRLQYATGSSPGIREREPMRGYASSPSSGSYGLSHSPARSAASRSPSAYSSAQHPVSARRTASSNPYGSSPNRYNSDVPNHMTGYGGYQVPPPLGAYERYEQERGRGRDYRQPSSVSPPERERTPSSVNQFAPSPTVSHATGLVGGVTPPAPAPAATTTAPTPEDDDMDERNNLTTMQQNLERTMGHINTQIEQPAPGYASAESNVGIERSQQTNVSITTYTDFTSKYGMAYLLNNGNVGVHFNDSTKMVWNTESDTVQYISRSRQPVPGQSGEEGIVCMIDNYPDTLKKKITLITYFRNFLSRGPGVKPVKDGQPEVMYTSKGKQPLKCDPHETEMVYVKRWLKTRYAIIFRLSNKSVQVSFFDGTEILLFSEARQVTYTDETGEQQTFSLSSMMVHPKPEIAHRLKYTKEIICRLINKA